MLTLKEVDRLFAEKIKSSGLTREDAKKLNYKPLTADQVQELGHPAFCGFKIPYFTAAGKPTGFYRLRYLENTQRGLARHTARKELRYIQPAQTPEVYMPQLVDWKKVLDNKKVPLIITEGELKAAAATKHGMPTLGLGGVWSWKSKNNFMAHLPFFDLVDWANREVVIVFDSDAAHNPKVQQAQNALCAELTRLGAGVIISKLPTLPQQSKTGLDDLIVAQGPEQAYYTIMQNSDYYDAIKPLRELNTEVVYVKDPGLILKLETGQKINPKNFVDHAYSDRNFAEEVPQPNGDVKTVVKSAPKEWLKWPQRSVVERLVYEPGAEQFTQGCYNSWTGWGCEPEKGSILPWRKLMYFLFRGQGGKEAMDWFEQWLAYPLQNPGAKLYTACILWSVGQGVGKSLIGHTMFRIYGENAAEIGDDEIESGSNDWAENKQFVLADDIMSDGARKKSFAESVRRMITREKLWINIKYVPKYSVRDCLNYYMTSNHPDALYMEDRDRRMFVWEVLAQEPLPMEFYREYKAWLDGGGAAHLFHHLLELDCSAFEPDAAAPVTTSKKDMIQAGKSDLSAWVAGLVEDPESTLGKNYRLWSTEELLLQYDPMGKSKANKNTMAKELKRAGLPMACEGAQVRLDQGRTKLWVIGAPELLKVLDSPAKAQKRYAQERREGRAEQQKRLRVIKNEKN